ncbi:MAG: ammonium transporter [Gammaproteobacteria bacterium]|nr:ammonium transporter [Gammaproteobacteria bacterium]MBT4147156.1 ammonium transporter [Gammaproteobacteria bacterium]MBT5222890.1 ammonium transporter [Gammaproteobacteria bacterium]MBT5825469.1 ammonium transporter [Gammaproteobacteria bacterium]MBT5967441.1 ammonium transporter [Gammaproteobacteria bacterium]
MNYLTNRNTSLLIVLLCLPSLAWADELNQANTAWILTSTALVLFMTLPGLSLFYAGLVRSKNVLSVLMQCFAIACMISIMWLVGMYSLIFTDGGAVQPFIGSLSKAFVPDMGPDSLTGDIPEAVYFMFQMTFAIITPALIVGAFAERMKFSSMMLFSALWALLVYVPVCHWVWGGGWLADMGVMDFAGGIVIHVTAGVSALVAALVMGNRKGFPTVAMPPHNMPMVVTGAGMLWVGWFGFNAGSALAADGSAGMAMLVTHISAAAGSLTWMVIEWVRFGKPSVLGIVTGMVAGLGTITPASGFVGPAGALFIGITAGIACFYAVQIIKRHLHIDDSLDVFPVHGVGGIVGSILTGVFAAESLGGLGLGDVTIAHQVGVQALAVGVTIIWTVVFTYIILKVLDAIMGLRVSEDQEVEGLDVVMHEETGYHNM